MEYVCISERLQGRMTRAKKNAALQQRTVNVDKAQQILEQKTPLVVDRDKLKVRWMAAAVIVESPSVSNRLRDASALHHFPRSCWREW